MTSLRDLTEPGAEPSALVRFRDLATQLGAAFSLRQIAGAFESAAPAPLRFLAQNTALLPATLYKGPDQDEAIAGVVAALRAGRPDVAGLSECWTGTTKDQIRTRVQDLYPHSLTGPGTGLVNADLEDGGLLLLSRYPIVDHHETIFHACAGEDCLSSKGALHARISVPGHAAPYDVFLSHTQSPNPETAPDASGRAAVLAQMPHLGAFIAACRGDGPALLMGDLNVAADGSDFAELVKAFAGAADLWPSCGRASLAAAGITDPDRMRGLTIDDASPFESGARLPADAPTRNHHGDRIDYAFVWPGRLFRALFGAMEIVRTQTETGRDLSDHYGLSMRQAKLARLAHVLDPRPIAGVQVTLKSFRCLEVTDGTIPGVGDDDEVQFTFTGRPQSGAPRSYATAVIEDISNGTSSNFDPLPVLTFDDPGASFTVEVSGQEIDASSASIGVGPLNLGGIETGHAQLGPSRLSWSREQLQALQSEERTLPILAGDGGQYVVTVSLTVKRNP